MSSKPTKAVAYTEAIDAQLQGLQADRLLNMHAALTRLAAIATGEQQRLARAALADLDAYCKAHNRAAEARLTASRETATK